MIRKNNLQYVKVETALMYDILECCGAGQMVLYQILLSHKNKGGAHTCFPKITTLMKKSRFSKTTLFKYLNDLEMFGFIKVKSGVNGQSNNYYFPQSDLSITKYTKDDIEYISGLSKRATTMA